MWIERKTMFEEELETLLADIETEPDSGIREIMQNDIEQDRRVLEIINIALEKLGYQRPM